MSSEFGKNVKVSIFGESHSKAIGMILSGISSGERIDQAGVEKILERRAPGRNDYSTTRKETDKPFFLSGVLNNVTTGTPIGVMIENNDTRSKDYEELKYRPRPGHADFTAYVKYGSSHDIRGGGHFSGRLTAPLCVAGAICLQILERKGITIGAHINSIGDVKDTPYSDTDIDSSELLQASGKIFPVNDDANGELMKDNILAAKEKGDSIGGTIECGIIGLPAGLGNPMFSGLENRISQAIFGIPAIKGIEFGAGFSASNMLGSEYNDQFYITKNAEIKTRTNKSGGIQGGISNGMPVIFRVAVRPTASVSIQQDTVDLRTKENVSIAIKGRHDPCIVPRAVPCVEAVAAIVILDMIYDERQKNESR